MKQIYLSFSMMCLALSYTHAQQVGIGTNTPDASAKLDIASGGTMGILFPRVALTATNVAGPVTSPANWLTVFNTATAGSGTTAVVPGLYYWNGTAWVKLDTGSALGDWKIDGNSNGAFRTLGTNDAFDLGFETNGAERMRIMSAGNVGIGTVLPSTTARLHIDLGTSTTDGVLITGTFNNTATIPNLGAGSRMMYYPGKAVLRAGSVTGTQWDDANTGVSSVAFGRSTIASGFGSTAMGFQTTASGQYSTAMGALTTASASESMAMGTSTIASGESSTAMGELTTASGEVSTAMGFQTIASGSRSTAMGNTTTASGINSTTMGQQTAASGANATAMGQQTAASGTNSTAMGLANTASSYGETVLGIGATTYTPSANGATQFRVANVSDRLFVVGNAIDNDNSNSVDVAERSNALTILKNGNIGIGNAASAPTTVLDVAGSTRIRTLTAGYVKSDASGNLSNGAILAADLPAGSGNYIQNQNAAAQTTSNYWVSGNGRMNGGLTVGAGATIDNNNTNTGTIAAGALAFGNGSGEGIGSKRNAGGNQYGLDFYTNSINRMVVTQAGNVGIGTTGPGATLNVIHPTANTTPTKPTGNWAAIVENNQDAADSRNGLAVATRWGSDASTIFEAGSYWTGSAQAYTPILSVKGNLNVGVGISSPPNKFTVNNANTTPATIGSYPFAVARGSSVEYTVGSDGNYVYNQSWNSKALLINAMGNNVGIGMSTLPTQKLDVQGGNARINNVFIGDVGHGATWAGLANSSQANTTAYGLLMSSDGAYTLINKQNTGSGYIGFRVANADQVVILNNGNMGIGNTGPGYKLSVNGTIEAIDAFGAGGQNLRIGDDTYFSDVDLGSTLGLYSTSQNFANMSIGNVANDPGMVSGGTPNYIHSTGTQTFGNGGRYSMIASLSVNGNTSGETGGFYADGNSTAIWSPGDANQGQPAALLYFMDEDFYDGNGNPYDNTALKSYINTAGALVTVSDERKKNTIKPISNALSRIQNIGGYEYYFNLDPEEVKKGDVAKLQSGVLAQEIAKQFPTVVEQSQQGDMFVNYSAITPYLIEAIKEQQAQLKAQQEEIKALRALIEQK